MRLENPRRARLRVVEQSVGRLCARPIAARLVDRRARGLSQLLRSFEQATVQAFVAQIGVGKLLPHPLDRLGADLHHSLHVRIFAARRLSQSVCYRSSPIDNGIRLPNAAVCVQRFRDDPSNPRRKPHEMCVIERCRPFTVPFLPKDTLQWKQTTLSGDYASSVIC
jgi:hypothetical protein